MSISTIASDFAQGFDDIRKELLGLDAKLVLLKEDGVAVAFNEVQVITVGWHSEYSTFFGTTTFHVADLEATTASNVRKATHLIVKDSTLAALNNTLHEMKAETAPPSSDSPWWKIRAEPLSRKYIAPNEI
jgi:hypothetical protein